MSAVESPRRIRAGEWSFELIGDEVRAITYGNRRILDSVRPAVRDPNWNTIAMSPESTVVDEVAGSARIMIYGGYSCEQGRARGDLTVRAGDDGFSIRYGFEPDHDFITARTGLTVLVPREFQGCDGTYCTPDGYTRRFRFPLRVCPYQPVFDIVGICYWGSGLETHVDFSGDVFEMEDQRNWCDASFKIYSRPLARPFPFVVESGTRVQNEVRISVKSCSGPVIVTETGAAGPEVDLDALITETPPIRLPGISLGATTRYLTEDDLDRGRVISPVAIVAEVTDLYPLERVFASLRVDTQGGRIPVDLRMAVSEPDDVAGILDAFAATGMTLLRVGVVDRATHVTTGPLWQALRCAMRGRDAELICGTRGHFAEFNRQIHSIVQPGAAGYWFSLTPQMHTREEAGIERALNAVQDVIGSARALIDDRPLLLGPVTLRARLNVVATDPGVVDRDSTMGYGAELTWGSVDPRHDSAWAGAWTCSMFLNAAASGASQVCFYEVQGPRGVVRAEGTLNPSGTVLEQFMGLAGCPARIGFLNATMKSAWVLLGQDDPVLVVSNLEKTALRFRLGSQVLEVAPGCVATAGSLGPS